MKIVPIDIIKSVSGKICRHSDTSVTLNSSSGKMFTQKLCNPYTGPASSAQTAQRQAFATKSAQVNTWLNANKPSTTNGENGTAAYQEAQALKRQLQLSSVRQVIYKYMAANGTVTLPSGQSGSTSGGGSSTSGGGTSGGGTSSGGTSSGGGSTTGGGGTTSGGDGYGD